MKILSGQIKFYTVKDLSNLYKLQYTSGKLKLKDFYIMKKLIHIPIKF